MTENTPEPDQKTEPPDNTLGARIRAKRDARIQQHAAVAKMQAQAEAADQIAVLHARIDKLIADNELKA